MSIFNALFRAQLGQTTDPTELIPGNPESVFNAAQLLRSEAQTFEDTADNLGHIEIPGWKGAASNAFWDKFSPERINWLRASDAMTDAAAALDRHAEALSFAQTQAGEAIALWERGVAATEQAKQAHAAEINRVNQFNQSIGTGLVDQTPAQPPAFVDPGEQLRERARELLRRAREQFDESGDAVADDLGAGAGQDSNAPSWLSKVADAVSKAVDERGLGDSEASFFSFGNDGPVTDKRSWGDHDGSDDSDGIDWKVMLAEVSGEANLWEVGADGKTTLGPLDLSGSAALKTLGVDGTAGLSIGKDGLKGELTGSAYLAKATAEGSAEWGIAAVNASAEGFVGAEAGVEASLGKDGLKLGAEAFAGAKIEGSAHADVGGIGAGVKGEAWAGVGVSADATLGMQDGKFTIGGELGAGLGVGGKLGFEVTVDPGKVIDTVGSAADAIGDAASTVVGGVGDAASSAWDNTFGRL